MSRSIPLPKIRPEAPVDHPATRDVLIAAFPTPLEADLVESLRVAGRLTVSLVALQHEIVVGHIAFSPVTTQWPAAVPGVDLAPLAVAPAFEGRGIGSDLIRHGLRACRDAHFGWVAVLGEPAYYRRFGFERASQFGLQNEYGVDDEFMVVELAPGSLPRGRGLIRYAPEFAICGGVQ